MGNLFGALYGYGTLQRSLASFLVLTIAQHAFWTAYGAVDILIDLAVIGLPVYLLYDLQLRYSKKVSVILAFGVRAM